MFEQLYGFVNHITVKEEKKDKLSRASCHNEMFNYSQFTT